MKNSLLFVLVLTNAGTGYLYLDSVTRFDALKATIIDDHVSRMSDEERAFYGQQCLEWLQTRHKDIPKDSDDFFVGRSWKKYGQFVFEIAMPSDDKDARLGNLICTFDAQSGVMASYDGAGQERWMFY